MGGTEDELRFDRWGYGVRTSSHDCMAAINAYHNQVLSYGRDGKVILEAVKCDRGCVLANVLAAHFLSSSDPSRVPSHIETAKSRLGQATAYEKAVFYAVSSLITENRDDDLAFDLHYKLLKDFPRDLVSLKRAQVFCFYIGQPDLSLKLVEQVLPVNQHEDYVYGMLAFPLLELGRFADAEKAAKKGYEINDRDCWAQHGLCHVLQFECRFKEAVQFMEQCSATWSSCSSFMITHNWWHMALCYLEGHAPIARVLDIYDNQIMKELERSDASDAEVYLNALGLLLRVYVRGHGNIFEDRLKSLAKQLTNQIYWHIEWHLDLLCLWALACVGEVSKAESLLGGLKLRFWKMSKKKHTTMQKGILLAEAMLEFGKENYGKAVELLWPDFDAYTCKMVGASDEQLDVFNEVWYVMLLNAGQVEKAIEVMEGQVKKRDGAAFLWQLLERGYKLMGRPEARSAAEKARFLENAYFKSPS